MLYKLGKIICIYDDKLVVRKYLYLGLFYRPKKIFTGYFIYCPTVFNYMNSGKLIILRVHSWCMTYSLRKSDLIRPFVEHRLPKPCWNLILFFSSRKHAYIILTPSNPCIVKLGIYGIYIIFLFPAKNVEAVLTSTHNLCFEQKYEKYQNFLSEKFHFLVVKFSVYLNRHVS